jgi:hypothetical protein
MAGPDLGWAMMFIHDKLELPAYPSDEEISSRLERACEAGVRTPADTDEGMSEAERVRFYFLIFSAIDLLS